MIASPFFKPLPMSGYNTRIDSLEPDFKKDFRTGSTVLHGIQFELGAEKSENILYLDKGTAPIKNKPFVAKHLVFLHACETTEPERGADGIIKHLTGNPALGEEICQYIIKYSGGEELSVPIRSRHEINSISPGWGYLSFGSVPASRFKSIPTVTDDICATPKRTPGGSWGYSQCRVDGYDSDPVQWLFAWENPHPDAEIIDIEERHKSGKFYLLGLSAGDVDENPLRYSRRKKTVLKREKGVVDIDLGQIISVLPRPVYENSMWESGYNNKQPVLSSDEYIVEYTAHRDAIFYLNEEKTPLNIKDLPLSETVKIEPSEQPVLLKVLGPDGKPTPVKVHAHGAGGEYLPPRHRHRIPNPYWFEDYSVDFVHGPHWCTYIDGQAEYLLPLGEVYFEVSKGFEIKPVRQRFTVGPETKEIVINLEHVLDWRSKGWVTADTHVHFLSPHSALLEGEAEGVNLVNLLASQWGELFTNIGDFDGKSELCSDSKDFMVRVGTENRQPVLGHISLLGYEGAMILPLTTGGPNESAIGDPVETTLTQWAKQCKAQNGLVILPHFPNPRAENAAAIVSELIDGVEMTSWMSLYDGIDPYSLSDWYRYLNCGYHIAAVGGTDKMSAETAVGTIRTYALIDGVFTHETWKDAVRKGRTFATYGALVDMRVEGKCPGDKIEINKSATLQVEWSVASATIPITAVELVVGGETVGVKRFDNVLGTHDGYFSVSVDKSTWIAIRIRGHQPDKPEIITAHTSTVMISVDGKRPMDALDAVTIIEQIEGVTAYVKTLGTKAEDRLFKEVIANLTSAHRALHNRMHEMGHYHEHTIVDDHPEHHK